MELKWLIEILLYALKRSSSDNDILNSFQLVFTYDVPELDGRTLSTALLNHWSVDGRVTSRSALPVDIQGDLGTDPNTGASSYFHPNLVIGQRLYLQDSTVPGARRINYRGFGPAGTNIEGNTPRNYARAFTATQGDVALCRDFLFQEGIGIQFRVEAFNVLNHPIYGYIYNALSYGDGLFKTAQNTQANQLGGLNSLYQTGGPRSLQIALRLHF